MCHASRFFVQVEDAWVQAAVATPTCSAFSNSSNASAGVRHPSVFRGLPLSIAATAGQMMLFLGVVTLVSGGMEQTTQEVARRVDSLGERLVKIEQAAFTGKSQAPSQRVEVTK